MGFLCFFLVHPAYSCGPEYPTLPILLLASYTLHPTLELYFLLQIDWETPNQFYVVFFIYDSVE